MDTPGARSRRINPSGPGSITAKHKTSRTLRRRLSDEAVSFTAIVDDFHRAVAIEYVAKTKLSYDDIAVLVGFSDVANFRRAFKRWTGKSPGELRG